MRLTAIFVTLILVALLIVPHCFAETVPAVIDNNQEQSQQEQTPSAQATQQTQQPKTQTTAPQSSTSQIQQQAPNQPNSAPATTTLPGINISAGIPLVSTEQAIDKADRMTWDLHRLATTIAPMATVLILAVGGLFFFLCKAARMAVVWAIIGLVVAIWSIPIVGYVLHWIRA